MTQPSRSAARPLLALALALALTGAAVATASASGLEEPGTSTLLDVVVDVPDAPLAARIRVDGDGTVTPVAAPASTDGIAAHFAAEAEHTASGDAETQDAVAAASDVSSVTATAGSAGAHTAYVVTVDDPGRADDVPLATAVADARRALDYWMLESQGALASFTVAETATLHLSSSCAVSYTDLWERAAALFPGIDFADSPAHLVVYTPAGCTYDYLGVASVGSMATGGYTHIARADMAVTVHELGHHMGLGHGNLLWGDVFGRYGVAEYYGFYSPMAGYSGEAPTSLDAGFRHYLGLPGADASTATVPLTIGTPDAHTVTLKAIDGDTPSAATFVDSHGFRYFLEHRSGTGRDASTIYAGGGTATGVGALTASYHHGVVLSLMEPGGDALYVIGRDNRDGSLSTAFRAGDRFSDPMGEFSFEVVTATSDGATVRVVAGPARSTTTVATAPQVRYGTPGKARITVSSTVLPHGTVSVTYGSQVWTTTLVDGRATLFLPESWKPGTRTLGVRYSGASAFAPSTTAVTATVLRAVPTVTAVAKTSVRAGAKATFLVKVASPVAAEQGYVRVLVNGQAVSAKTRLVRSGSVYQVRVTTGVLPQGRVSVKYLGNTYLAPRTVATRYYASR